MRGFILAAPLALLFATPLVAEGPEGTPAEVVAETSWGFEASDLQPEDGYLFGQLANGMRYVIRANATPEGTALVRMEVAAGRLDEYDDERGLAHFVEHMAFNGSTNVPEGEMVKLLERLGLAFGADTNAVTNFTYTQYKLDLPNTRPELLDTALMLMRETASELTFAPEAVERERGVLLAERRERTNFTRLESADQVDFFFPGSLFAERFPVAGREDIDKVDAAALKAFWQRTYVPSRTTLVVVGDFDPAEVEQAIIARFADWEDAATPEQPEAGPVDPDYRGASDVYLDPALSDGLIVAQGAPWIERPDTKAERRQAILRAIGYAILQRRFTRATRIEDPPFQSASFGGADIFEAGRQTILRINAIEGRWADGMTAAEAIVRQFLEYGVSEAEIAEQVARSRTALENAVSGQDTRSHGYFAGRAIRLAREERIPTSPETNLALFETTASKASPDEVMAAIRSDIVPFDDPLIRFAGRTAPDGGEAALREAWKTARAQPVSPPEAVSLPEWDYTDFGAAGEIVSDTIGTPLDIRQVVFANGARLNLKRTELEQDRILVAVTIDGGTFIETREEPLKTNLIGMLPAGGLGKYTQDELQSVLAGRSANFSIGATPDRFSVTQRTTPRDLELQLQLIAAFLTDPAYHTEPLARYRNGIPDYFASLVATPGAALRSQADSILSSGDPRFTIQSRQAYEELDFDYLRNAIEDRLKNGAMEIALVGDFEEEAAIALVAQTLGALPAREGDFRDYPDSRHRVFTGDRVSHTIYHDGEADQALVSYNWPTRDYWDAEATIELNLLRAVTALEMTDALREELGKSYSPSVSNEQSRSYTGWGLFRVRAGVETDEVTATREAIEATVERLRSEPVDADILQRARQPILEGIDNALKTNGSWLGYVRRAQTEPVVIDRFLAARARYEAVTPERLREVAEQYLTADGAVQFVVLPRPVQATIAAEE
ncbi:M16 family metallopeptidase [Parerythrobacter aestuarii]|uniref:M16 family metallopeptidase n=1 Tax=Parerythrobacter aestuarii TaxID=3020909 RepID=UPI0024DEC78F|nr:insulinase family protein [Parerythrobacter aestuarii]